MRLRALADVPMYGHLPAPRPPAEPPLRTTDRCPECRVGRVERVSGNPTDVQYQCSRRCGWDA